MMIKKIISLLMCLITLPNIAQVGIGTTTPDSSSILEMESTSQGVLIPRMSQVEKNAIINPATGLLVYQTDSPAGFYYFDGSIWQILGLADNDWTVSANDMYNNNSGYVGVGTNTPTAKLHIEDNGTPSTILNQDFELGMNPFTTGGSLPWLIQSSNVNGGINASGSGSIGHSQTSYMEYNVTIPAGGATLSFYYEVSSESGFDFLRFYIDGIQQNSWSGNVSYTQQTYVLTAGNHLLRWSYTKDSSVSSGSDSAYIDDVLITNSTSSNAIRIVDGNEGIGKVLMSDGSGNASWEQLTQTNINNMPQIASFQGMQIPICDSVINGDTGSFNITVNGTPTTVNWTILSQNTAANTTKINSLGDEVLIAPFRPERLQVRYDFSPALPFTPNGLIFTANNNLSYPDTFSLNYANKSANSITVNITRTDIYGDDGGVSYKCWAGQFYFDVFMTN